MLCIVTVGVPYCTSLGANCFPKLYETRRETQMEGHRIVCTPLDSLIFYFTDTFAVASMLLVC